MQRPFWFALFLAVLFAALPLVVPVDAQGLKGDRQTSAAAGVGVITITSPGPLEGLFLGADLSAQIDYTGDPDYQVFPSAGSPADYGTFLVVTGTNPILYAPDFDNHDAGSATSSLGPYTPFTSVSQSGVIGSGSRSDPYSVITVVDAGATGLRLTQSDSYIVGEENYRTDIQITNSGSSAQQVVLYRAMDCYLNNSDNSYGWVQPGTGAVACAVNQNNSPAARIEQLTPLTGGSQYIEARYNQVWAAIGSHQPFPNSCRCDEFLDSGAGLSWVATIPAGGSVSFSHLTGFSPAGNVPLRTTKVADNASSRPGGRNGYTISLFNPNGVAVTVDGFFDVLPAGFSYIAGTTTGATTNDPAITGQSLTWSGPFTVAAGGTLTLHFDVTVAGQSGTYYNRAAAQAQGFSVIGTGDTAPVTVENQTSVTLAELGSAPVRSGRWLGAALLVGLLALAWGTRRRR